LEWISPDFRVAARAEDFPETKQHRVVHRNVEGVKLDECDSKPDPRRRGLFRCDEISRPDWTAKAMHSLSDWLYQQTMWQPVSTKRAAHLIGSATRTRCPALCPMLSYSDSYDARCYVRGLANAGFSGLSGVRKSGPLRPSKIFYRRIEAVFFRMMR